MPSTYDSDPMDYLTPRDELEDLGEVGGDLMIVLTREELSELAMFLAEATARLPYTPLIAEQILDMDEETE